MRTYRDQISHPWQSSPTELIVHGLEHLRQNTDFDQRIAFLSFDVGVEILFKTFLSLPEKVSAAKSSYGDRKKAIDGNFHTLVQGVELARPDIAQKHNLAHVQVFHDMRNMLYHQGNGITVERDKLNSYGSIAVKLLNDLLGVDLNDVLLAPDIEACKARMKEQAWDTVENKKQELAQARMRLGEVARYAAEIIAPDLAKSVFIRTLQKHYSESEEEANTYLIQSFRKTFPDDLNRIPLHELEPRHIFYDNNLLYLFIATVFIESDNPLGIYELSKYDPLEIFRQDDVTTDEHGQIVSVHEISTEEYAKKITDWLLDNMARIEKNILILEAWLDRQSDSLDWRGR